MHRSVVLFIVVVLTVSGCSWSFFGGKNRPSQPAVAQGVSVEFIAPGAVQKGGKLQVIPFSAGADAEAGEALDRLALMMVKGVSDALDEGGGFVLVTGDDAANADIIIKGHIEELKVQGHFKKAVSIKVRGDICRARTEAVIGLVYAERHVVNGKKNMDEAFYNIGYAVAKKLSQ